MSYLKIVREVIAELDLKEVNSSISFSSSRETPTFDVLPDTKETKETRKGQAGPEPGFRFPAIPVLRSDLDAELRHWPGNPRCQVAELERAGIPRDEAIRRVRERYATNEQEAPNG